MSAAEQKLSIRPYEDGDEEGILALWKAVYPEHSGNRNEWMRWWQWKYKDNPSGMGVICLAEMDGRIIGHTAELPMLMKVGSESILVGVSLDAMTHPDYRRQGIFVSLVKGRGLESEKRGIRATYGFRNKFSYPYPALARKVDMFDGATMQKVVKLLNWPNVLRSQTRNRILMTAGPLVGGLLVSVLFKDRKVPAPVGLTISRVSHFDESIDELWERVSGRYRVAVLRRKEYLNWRYIAAPHRQYSVYVARQAEATVGFLVLGQRQQGQARMAIIVDIVAESQEVAECLISEAVECCRQDSQDLVWSARIAGTSLAKAYRRNGFVSLPLVKSIGTKGRSSSSNITRQMRNPKNWFLQMGDSDEA